MPVELENEDTKCFKQIMIKPLFHKKEAVSKVALGPAEFFAAAYQHLCKGLFYYVLDSDPDFSIGTELR